MRLFALAAALAASVAGVLAAPAPVPAPAPAPVPVPAPVPLPEIPDLPTGVVPAYLNETFIYFPQASNWFTLGVTNTVQWLWASNEQANLRIVLSNPDAAMLETPMVLAKSTPAADFSYTTKDKLVGPRAGGGYIVTLYKADSDELIAASAPFEIKPVGSDADVVKPYLAATSMRGNAGTRPSASEAAATAVVVALVFSALLDTPIIPGTSYGVQKTIGEMYAFDYGRKGYLDTRSLRLPTVAIRTGAPSSAASSFISGLIREPLQGLPSVCPIASGPDDPMLDGMPVYLSRAKTVFRNIVWGLCMPEDNFKYGSGSRSVNIPGITVTPRQILQALETHGGPDAVKLVSYEKDAAVIAICETWAGAYDNSEFLRMGFEVDDAKTGFADAVQDFKAELAAEQKK